MSSQVSKKKIKIIFESDDEETIDLVILITGDRYWTSYDTIFNILSEYKNRSVLLIHGMCYGADILSDKAAKELGFQISCNPADWKKFGRSAGPIRNTAMVKEALEYKNKDIEVKVLAFHDNIETSKGTKSCITIAKKYGLDVSLFRSKN